MYCIIRLLIFALTGYSYGYSSRGESTHDGRWDGKNSTYVFVRSGVGGGGRGGVRWHVRDRSDHEGLRGNSHKGTDTLSDQGGSDDDYGGHKNIISAGSQSSSSAWVYGVHSVQGGPGNKGGSGSGDQQRNSGGHKSSGVGRSDHAKTSVAHGGGDSSVSDQEKDSSGNKDRGSEFSEHSKIIGGNEHRGIGGGPSVYEKNTEGFDGGRDDHGTVSNSHKDSSYDGSGHGQVSLGYKTRQAGLGDPDRISGNVSSGSSQGFGPSWFDNDQSGQDSFIKHSDNQTNYKDNSEKGSSGVGTDAWWFDSGHNSLKKSQIRQNKDKKERNNGNGGPISSGKHDSDGGSHEESGSNALLTTDIIFKDSKWDSYTALITVTEISRDTASASTTKVKKTTSYKNSHNLNIGKKEINKGNIHGDSDQSNSRNDSSSKKDGGKLDDGDGSYKGSGSKGKSVSNTLLTTDISFKDNKRDNYMALITVTDISRVITSASLTKVKITTSYKDFLNLNIGKNERNRGNIHGDSDESNSEDVGSSEKDKGHRNNGKPGGGHEASGSKEKSGDNALLTTYISLKDNKRDNYTTAITVTEISSSIASPTKVEKTSIYKDFLNLNIEKKERNRGNVQGDSDESNSENIEKDEGHRSISKPDGGNEGSGSKEKSGDNALLITDIRFEDNNRDKYTTPITVTEISRAIASASPIKVEKTTNYKDLLSLNIGKKERNRGNVYGDSDQSNSEDVNSSETDKGHRSIGKPGGSHEESGSKGKSADNALLTTLGRYYGIGDSRASRVSHGRSDKPGDSDGSHGGRGGGHNYYKKFSIENISRGNNQEKSTAGHEEKGDSNGKNTGNSRGGDGLGGPGSELAEWGESGSIGYDHEGRGSHDGHNGRGILEGSKESDTSNGYHRDNEHHDSGVAHAIRGKLDGSSSKGGLENGSSTKSNSVHGGRSGDIDKQGGGPVRNNDYGGKRDNHEGIDIPGGSDEGRGVNGDVSREHGLISGDDEDNSSNISDRGKSYRKKIHGSGAGRNSELRDGHEMSLKSSGSDKGKSVHGSKSSGLGSNHEEAGLNDGHVQDIKHFGKLIGEKDRPDVSGGGHSDYERISGGNEQIGDYSSDHERSSSFVEGSTVHHEGSDSNPKGSGGQDRSGSYPAGGNKAGSRAGQSWSSGHGEHIESGNLSDIKDPVNSDGGNKDSDHGLRSLRGGYRDIGGSPVISGKHGGGPIQDNGSQSHGRPKYNNHNCQGRSNKPGGRGGSRGNRGDYNNNYKRFSDGYKSRWDNHSDHGRNSVGRGGNCDRNGRNARHSRGSGELGGRGVEPADWSEPGGNGYGHKGSRSYNGHDGRAVGCSSESDTSDGGHRVNAYRDSGDGHGMNSPVRINEYGVYHERMGILPRGSNEGRGDIGDGRSEHGRNHQSFKPDREKSHDPGRNSRLRDIRNGHGMSVKAGDSLKSNSGRDSRSGSLGSNGDQGTENDSPVRGTEHFGNRGSYGKSDRPIGNGCGHCGSYHKGSGDDRSEHGRNSLSYGGSNSGHGEDALSINSNSRPVGEIGDTAMNYDSSGSGDGYKWSGSLGRSSHHVSHFGRNDLGDISQSGKGRYHNLGGSHGGSGSFEMNVGSPKRNSRHDGNRGSFGGSEKQYGKRGNVYGDNFGGYGGHNKPDIGGSGRSDHGRNTGGFSGSVHGNGSSTHDGSTSQPTGSDKIISNGVQGRKGGCDDHAGSSNIGDNNEPDIPNGFKRNCRDKPGENVDSPKSNSRHGGISSIHGDSNEQGERDDSPIRGNEHFGNRGSIGRYDRPGGSGGGGRSDYGRNSNRYGRSRAGRHERRDGSSKGIGKHYSLGSYPTGSNEPGGISGQHGETSGDLLAIRRTVHGGHFGSNGGQVISDKPSNGVRNRMAKHGGSSFRDDSPVRGNEHFINRDRHRGSNKLSSSGVDHGGKSEPGDSGGNSRSKHDNTGSGHERTSKLDADSDSSDGHGSSSGSLRGSHILGSDDGRPRRNTKTSGNRGSSTGSGGPRGRGGNPRWWVIGHGDAFDSGDYSVDNNEPSGDYSDDEDGSGDSEDSSKDNSHLRRIGGYGGTFGNISKRKPEYIYQFAYLS